MDDVALGIGKDLDLDVARLLHEALENEDVAAEGGERLAARAGQDPEGFAAGKVTFVPGFALAWLTHDVRALWRAVAALAGGSLLVLADTLARTLIAPQQLPVGVLTALIGVPVFLFLLSRQPK